MCAGPGRAVSPEGFREVLRAQFSVADKYKRNPRSLHYRVSTILPIMRWIDKPDRLEVEVRFGQTLKRVQESKPLQIVLDFTTPHPSPLMTSRGGSKNAVHHMGGHTRGWRCLEVR